jgi:BirA family biotin operon repressor/biotin-[acetyl-CoA-carboxylase] ligase
VAEVGSGQSAGRGAKDGVVGETGRAGLRESALRDAVVVPGGLWTQVEVVAETGSTNADVALAALAGAAEGLVLVAESQRSGRGRLDRRWVAPPGSSLMWSMLLRPAVAATRLGWLPLLAGVAVVEAVRRLVGVDAVLKWPNDVLVRGAPGMEYGKCAGLLAEVVNGGAPAVVVGIGLNVSQTADELPSGGTGLPATSLALAGSASVDREVLLRGLLDSVGTWYRRWIEADGNPEVSGLADTYRSMCITLGRQVEVSRPGGDVLSGTAESVDADGRLVVRTAATAYPVAAGDVIHVR